MTIDKKYIDQFINVTSNAAIASFHLVGKKDKIAADQAAVDAMRTELNKINMTGEIVIGEGSLDEAPMLFTGEILGLKKGCSQEEVLKAVNQLQKKIHPDMNRDIKTERLSQLVNEAKEKILKSDFA